MDNPYLQIRGRTSSSRTSCTFRWPSLTTRKGTKGSRISRADVDIFQNARRGFRYAPFRFRKGNWTHFTRMTSRGQDSFLHHTSLEVRGSLVVMSLTAYSK